MEKAVYNIMSGGRNSACLANKPNDDVYFVAAILR